MFPTKLKGPEGQSLTLQGEPRIVRKSAGGFPADVPTADYSDGERVQSLEISEVRMMQHTGRWTADETGAEPGDNGEAAPKKRNKPCCDD